MVNFKQFIQGSLGNYSELTPAKLTEEYGDYLFTNEEITMGYKLVRDALLFTNHRIILVDKQGATGKKTAFKSIHLDTIVEVEMETAGFGVDDSEITITYLKNVNQRANEEVHHIYKFEFPKKTDILPLYRFLGDVSMTNRERINNY